LADQNIDKCSNHRKTANTENSTGCLRPSGQLCFILLPFSNNIARQVMQNFITRKHQLQRAISAYSTARQNALYIHIIEQTGRKVLKMNLQYNSTPKTCHLACDDRRTVINSLPLTGVLHTCNSITWQTGLQHLKVQMQLN
jgi:hypothetical protein